MIDKKEKIFVASLLLSYHLVGLTGRKVDITDFVFLVVLFLWLIYIFTNKHYKIIWSYWHLLLLILSLTILLSLVNGDYMSLVFLLSVFKAFTVFFIMVNMIRERETAIFSLKIYLAFLAVVAEGVETEAQRLLLASHQCDFMQGYLFSRPLPPDAALAFLRERAPR